MRGRRITQTATSSNWSGLAQTGENIEGVEGDWTVPAVQPSGSPMYSSTWVGIDGFDDNDLIQTGTSQDTSDGYYAWWEILPLYAEMITTADGTPAPVAPGDQMVGSVKETVTPGTWTIYLDDVTQDWYFQQNFTYDGPGASAEWIEEAPSVSGSLTSLADFGNVAFTQTGIYGDFGAGGTTWYGTAMNSGNEIDMLNKTSTVLLAAPSAPTADPSTGQDFTDTYENTSIEVPVVTITEPTGGYQASTTIDVDYSATDSSSSIASYGVRYDVTTWNSRYLTGEQYPAGWQGTSSTKVQLDGTPGDEYCFDADATSQAGITSAWTPDSCAILPLGETSLAAGGPKGWSREHASGAYLDAFATTTTEGASLRLAGAWASRLAVVAARCPSCGLVDVYVNGKLLAHIDTRGKRLDWNQVFVLPAFPFGRATVRLEDASKHGRVIIEGLGFD